MRFSEPLLCLVTDRHRCGGRLLEQVIEDALAGGVGMVQLREKDLTAVELYRLGCRVRELMRDRATLIINDRVDVAIACGANGVQIGEQGLPVETVRETFGDDLLIGRSVHSVEGSLAAARAGADFLILGTIFSTPTHPGAVAGGTALVKSVADVVDIPVLGIGGITSENVASVIDAGACGAAVITAITQSPNPTDACHALVRNMNIGRARRHQGEIGRPV